MTRLMDRQRDAEAWVAPENGNRVWRRIGNQPDRDQPLGVWGPEGEDLLCVEPLASRAVDRARGGLEGWFCDTEPS